MPIYKLNGDRILKLKQTSFLEERIDEARTLQKIVINSIDTIEKDLFVLTNEFGDWEDSRRRIDILCIDKKANLVVVELKRTEDGGHMELQSIRYAAMIANMTFDKAVAVYQGHIEKNDLPIIDARRTILNFLEWDDINEEEFANDVRIILVSANFSKEVTTSVLWLIERDLDIKCIRIVPQRDADDLFFDIQQIIPLPETADYQVRLREKATEQRQARRENGRDYSRYDITINGHSRINLNKRQAMHFAISESVKAGISPKSLMDLTGEKRWIWVDDLFDFKEDFEAEFSKKAKNYDSSRWFNSDSELIRFDNKTFSFSNQHGKGTFELVQRIFSTFPKLEGEIYLKGRS